LNHGGKKDYATDVIRLAISAHPPPAIVLVTAANMFRATEKFNALPYEEQKRRVESGHDEHHRMVAEGLYRIIDCFNAVAQTAARVCIRMQPVDRTQKPETKLFDQADFDGRMKFYGKQPPDFLSKRGRM